MRKIDVTLKDGSTQIVDIISVKEYINSDKIKELKNMFVKRKGWSGDNGPTYYLNTPLTFDIETSYYDVDNDMKQRKTWMYIWQMTVNGQVIVGRTWNAWRILLKAIKHYANITDKRKAIIYVHNLAYEYQFIHTQLPVDSIFAREARKVISMRLGDYLSGFEFNCTYSISGSSLAKLAEDTKSCPVLKLKGDLDYDVFRTKNTILKDDEIRYCVNDVLILHYYIKELIDNEYTKCVGNIPITKTGFVRREARNTFGREKEYHKFYVNQKLDAHQFVMYFNAYRGGDTHAQALWCDEKIDNVYSFDLTSSYPYRILVEDFPLSKPITIEEPEVKHLNYLMKNKNLFIIDLNITDVEYKGLGYFTYIPIAKCLGQNGAETENGRIVKAKALRLCVTSVDFELMLRNYKFKISKIHSIVYHTKKGLLPESFRKFVIELYKLKTTLKGIQGKEVEYMQSKERINSVYGMCVTNPLNDVIEFDDVSKEWIKNEMKKTYDNEAQIQIELEQVYRSRNHFMAYEVGVWISAYARYDLHRALSKLGTDAVYWDTDSCKFVNKDNYKVFEKLNDDKISLLYSLGYSDEDIAPKDIKGKSHMIGLWDEEYPDGVTFKTFGAKKYFYTENGENHITVAGLNKKLACGYLSDELDGDVTNIELGQEIPMEHSGRTFSIYSEEPFTLNINGEEVSEKSYVSIVPTTYLLSDVDDHKLFILLNKALVRQRTI